jgi:hypothetical protein
MLSGKSGEILSARLSNVRKSKALGVVPNDPPAQHVKQQLMRSVIDQSIRGVSTALDGSR